MFPYRILFTARAILALSLAAQAHPNQQNAMWIQFEPSRAHLAVDVSLQELCAVWGISTEPGATPEHPSLLWAAQQHQTYLLEHLNIDAAPTRLSGKVLKVSPPAAMGDPERTFFQYELEYPLSFPPPERIQILQDMLGERSYAPGIPWDISYIVRTKRSDRETVSSWLLRCGTPLEIPTGWGEAPTPAPVGARRRESPAEVSAWGKAIAVVKRLLGL